jgi:hypothetical protein
LEIVRHAKSYRVEYNTGRPQYAVAWNTPLNSHLGRANPTIPIFEQAKPLPPPRHETR